VSIVEKWNAHIKIRQDMFGVFDLVVLSYPWGVIFIQVTSGANHAKRRKKLFDSDVWKFCREEEIEVCMAVESWRKNAKGRWIRRTELWESGTLPDYPVEIACPS
jgi:hypothetical protein